MSSDGEASDSLFTEPETERASHDLFRDENGQSCLFYLHRNITGNSRDTLIDQIELHGGTVVDHDRGVDTVLTALGTNRDAIQRAYYGCKDVEYRRVHVEFSNFIDKCIKKNSFKHRIPRRKPMPGVQPGTGRNSFTPDDDEQLCNWLAQRITYHGEGGRLGMKVYEELIESAEACPELQGWALRHTAASFRERYRKKREKMDKRIDEICKDIVVVPGQLHSQTRALNNLPKKRRAKETSDSEEDEDSEEQIEEEEESEEEVEPEPARRPSQRHSHPRRNAKRRQSTRSEPVSSRKGKEKAPDYDEEPMEDNDDEVEESEEVEDHGHEDIPEEYPPTYRTIQSSQEMLAANQASTSRQRVSFPPTTQPAKKPTSQPRRSQPQPRPTKTASSSSQHAVAPQSNPPPAQSIQPPGSQVPKRAARAPASMQRRLPSVPSPAAEAPFRNTRARSRSVEPRAVAARPPPVKRSRKAPPVPEIPIHEEAPQSSQYEDVFAAPIPETVAEELSVANLLTISAQDQSVRLSTTVRHPSMGTDDVQTRNQLFGNTSRSPLRPKNTRTAAELLRDFEEASEASITPIAVPRTNRPLAAAAQMRSRLRNKAPPAAPRAELHVAQPAPPAPVTPPRLARIRVSDSDSSVATSYPASGTRASALKKDLRRKEMMTPYIPPWGTRAADHN